MSYCSTCKFWKPFPADIVRGQWGKVLQTGGGCKHPSIREYISDEDYAADAMVYSYNESGFFWTGPDFGCVHHEPTVSNFRVHRELTIPPMPLMVRSDVTMMGWVDETSYEFFDDKKQDDK